MITDHFLVTDQVAIVTGAGRGIGRATALALAEAGADLVISARTADQLEEVKQQVARLGRRAVCVTADLSDLATLPGLVETATGQFGRLDIVVNNVGGSFPRPLLETSAAMFEKAFHFNVTTALELSKAAIPAMLASDPAGGSIVNISSAIGRMTDRGFAAYGTAKAALTHLTRLMATECAPRIRVNAIAVGSTATSALDMVLTDDGLRTAMEDNTPLRRLGDPLDIALGVLYLSSPAGSYLTGKILEIDGGLNAPNLLLGLPDL
ncbi:MAG TPA: SDR family oxidoreductase [Microthrixaceae bacterium]|jgi:7-alpha-hydroxysteroid dehydrogenase|nr:SDR family oxidoreductase [Microthrixaceae bacterium]HQF95108.1 SDR family oxidoreductase [Microthrixaceae bacterium]